jgi:hypothetical protein
MSAELTDDDADGLKAAIEAAHEIADTSINPSDWRLLRALEAAQLAKDNPPARFDPAWVAGLPPWSEVSEPEEPD